MKKVALLAALAVFSIGALTACQQQAPKQEAPKVEQKAPEAGKVEGTVGAEAPKAEGQAAPAPAPGK